MGAELVVAGVILSVVGAGVSAYGQHQAGKTQAKIAQFNADEQSRQARFQFDAMQVQVAQQQQEAEANYRLRSAEAEARLENAQRLENQAETQDAINRANSSQRREEGERLIASQRAMIAQSGVVESSGTPLDILADTVARLQLENERTAFQEELKRQTLFAERDQERLGGQFALAGATLDRDSQLASLQLDKVAARSSLMAGEAQAGITRATGAAAKQAANYQAAGTLLSGVGSAFSSYSKVK